MSTEATKYCDLLVKNRDTFQKVFVWSNPLMHLTGGSFFAGLNREADPEKLKECEKLLESKAGIFSTYRGNVRIPLLCRMAVSEDPEQYFEKVHSAVEQLKVLKWIDGDYRLLAALSICDHMDPDQYPETVVKIEELYKLMKENHPWLTSGEDVPFAAMLAVSAIDTNVLGTRMEECYQTLKEKFYDYNAVQSLSHVLSVNEMETAEKCRKVEEIFDLLKEKQHKYGTGCELSVLGALSMLNLSAESIAEEIVDADEYLKAQKGFGNFSLGDKNRRMFAAMMVLDAHAPAGALAKDSLMSSVLSIVIAMQVCMMVVMSSLCVTSISSSH